MEDSTVAVGGENDESECYIGKMALSLMLAWFFFFLSLLQLQRI